MTSTVAPPFLSLKHRFIGTSAWALGGYFAAQAVRFASNLVLTRLLAPDMFGLMSVVYLVFTAAAMLSDIGMGVVANQSPRGQDPRFLNVLWLLEAGRGIAMTVFALAVSGLLSLAATRAWLPAQSVYADARLPPLIAAVSVFGMIDRLQSTGVVLARRNLSIGLLTRLELGCQLATTAMILIWAQVQPSIWALAGGWLAGAALRTVLTHTVLPGPPLRFEWDKTAFREIRRFGKWAAVSSPLAFLLTGGGGLLLGIYLDAPTLGLYSIAMLLIAAFQGAIQSVLSGAVQPALGELARERPHLLKEKFYRIRQPLGYACVMSAGVLIVVGDPLVRWLYDERYADAGWMLRTMAVTLAVSHLAVFDACLIALSRVKRLSVLNAVRLVALYTLVPLGNTMGGARGAVTGLAAATLVNAAIGLVAQGRTGLLDLRRELGAVPLFGAGMLAGWLIRSGVGRFAG